MGNEVASGGGRRWDVNGKAAEGGYGDEDGDGNGIVVIAIKQ